MEGENSNEDEVLSLLEELGHEKICAFKNFMRELPAITDNISGVVLCHMAFILDMLLPTWAIDGPMKTINQEDFTWLKAEYGEEDEFGNKFVFVGSISDAINIPTHIPRPEGSVESHTTFKEHIPFDVDVLILSDAPRYTQEMMDTTFTHPGYCRIKTDSGDYHCPEYIVRRALNLHNHFHPGKFIRCGPAITDLRPDFEIDHVITFFCDFWPSQAEMWRKRNRFSVWPPVKLVESITSEGCQLVVKPHRESTNPDLEWRLSFVLAERRLIKSLSVVQKQAYVICKMLIKNLLNPGMAFSSYCLKTTLLWTMERLPEDMWTNPYSGLFQGVLAIIDMLIHFLSEFNIPMYFIPQNNLISHVPATNIKQNLRQLVSFRRYPLKVVLEFDRKYVIESTRAGSLTHMFPEIASASRVIGLSLGDCTDKHAEVIVNRYLIHQLRFRSLIGALSVSDHLRDLLNIHCFPEQSTVVFLASIFDQYMNTYLGAADMEKGTVGEMLCCLATVMSIACLRNKHGVHGMIDTEVSLVKTSFEKVLICVAKNPIVHVYLSLFLIQLGDTVDAATVLEAEVSFKKTRYELVRDYFIILPWTLDNVLGAIFMLKHGIIEIPAHILADYLLISMNKHDTKKCMELLKKLENECKDLVQHSIGFCDSHMLLGFTYLSLGDEDNSLRILDSGVLDEIRPRTDAETLIKAHANTCN